MKRQPVHPASSSRSVLYIPLRSDETKVQEKVERRFDDFISHYVQMKLSGLFLFERGDTALYPTTFRWNDMFRFQNLAVLQALYPTTFRWNGHFAVQLQDAIDSFISHYVQMKPCLAASLTAAEPPLYPTTFRWNRSCQRPRWCRRRLYIQLRSDETCCGRWFEFQQSGFISHYVQMKRNIGLIDALADIHLYIPLRSDETVDGAQVRASRQQPLYPTTFRWNSRLLSRWQTRTCLLYIPLRSDETPLRWSKRGEKTTFISHYVQMKLTNCSATGRKTDIFISHYVQMKPVSAGNILYAITFISHYVQMKHIFTNAMFLVGSALYPTTFRWNGWMRRHLFRFQWLYIPLRSDETPYQSQRRSFTTTFISHYVQMKQRRFVIFVFDFPTLYPTTFRWNEHTSLQTGPPDRLYIPLRSDETPSCGP